MTTTVTMRSERAEKATPGTAAGSATGHAPVARPGLSTIVGRGLRKRCPHCGRGAIFSGWARLRRRCPACGIELLRNQGDAWGFLLFVDRGAFIFPVVVALYFGIHLWSPALFAFLGVGIASLFVALTPNRYGACVALDYFTRAVAGDPDDELPVLPGGRLEEGSGRGR